MDNRRWSSDATRSVSHVAAYPTAGGYLTATLLVVAVLLPSTAHAQLMGHNLTGDFGLRSGSQAPVGRYAGFLLPVYVADTIKGPQGEIVEEGTVKVVAIAPFVSFVTETKILGGNYGALISPSFSNTAIEFPRLDVDDSQFGLADLYVVPFQLGWHLPTVDVTTSYGFFAPTGRFEPGADDNLGLGMWSHELSVGTTVYLDQAKSWHFATRAFYEIHSGKDGIDQKVGDLMTLEGGFGKTLSNASSVGLAYYAQWKVTEDSGADLADLPPSLSGQKDRGFGLGPEVDLLQGGLVIRGLFEFGSRNSLQGFVFVASLGLPF